LIFEPFDPCAIGLAAPVGVRKLSHIVGVARVARAVEGGAEPEPPKILIERLEAAQRRMFDAFAACDSPDRP